MENEIAVGSYDKFSLELLFLLISCFSLWKIVLFCNPRGGGHVISSFYGLICITALFRVIVISTETAFLNDGPRNVMAFKSNNWFGIVASEASQVIVSMMIYAIFILLVSFWSHMATKVTDREIAESRPLIRQPAATRRRGPLEKFFLVMAAFLIVETFNFVLFFLGYYDSSVLIFYDSIVFGGMSMLLFVEILFFSSKVRKILKTMADINANSSLFQIKRIKAITVVNSFYLLVRLALEAFAMYEFYIHWKGK